MPGGTPASDAEVFSRLQASAGITPNPEPEAPEAPEPEPSPEEGASPEAQAGAPEDTAPEEIDLSEGLPEEIVGKKSPAPEPEPEAAPEPETEPKPEKAGKDLRSQLEHFSSQTKVLSKEREALQKRVSELESQVKDAPNAKSLSEQLTKASEKITQLESALAMADYTQSQDFQERYSKPYEEKLTNAYKQFQGITKEDGSRLSNEEIQGILTLGERDAYRFIDEALTGPDARVASRLVGEVYGLASDKEKAMKNASVDAQRRQKEQTESRVRIREQYKGLFQQSRTEIADKFPDLYQPDKKDAKRTELLEAGYRLVEAAFNPPQSFDISQRARVEAEVYHRAGAFPAMRFRALRAEKEMQRLQQELAKYKGNSPGRGEVSGGGGEGGKEPEIGSADWIQRGLRNSQRSIKG